MFSIALRSNLISTVPFFIRSIVLFVSILSKICWMSVERRLSICSTLKLFDKSYSRQWCKTLHGHKLWFKLWRRLFRWLQILITWYRLFYRPFQNYFAITVMINENSYLLSTVCFHRLDHQFLWREKLDWKSIEIYIEKLCVDKKWKSNLKWINST